MAQFQYRALNADGAIFEGSVDAADRQEACRSLEGRGLTLVSVSKDTAGSFLTSNAFSFQRKQSVSHRALLDFTHLLSNLLSAGVPLSKALQILSREGSGTHAQQVWKKLRELVADGWSLADAMAKSPGTFSEIYIAMVRAGETGGFLSVVLGQITELQERDREIRSRVVSAMIYPTILVVLAIGVLIFLLVFFIPRFQTIFDGFDAALPLLTRIIVAASALVQAYGPLLIVAVFFTVWGVRTWLRTEQGRRGWCELVLRSPVVGPLQARFAMARFCRMFGTLAGSGVPLVNALRVAKEAIGNPVLTDAVNGAIDHVQKGAPLATGLAACPRMFPAPVIEMIAVAEETGGLDAEFLRIAANAEKELDRRLHSAVALAEPLILFVIAAIIGVIFIGMVIPIFSLQDHIR